ncbi:MAG: glutamine-synthetase adenylyltransferase [Paracoccaceae bacterium]|jgi:glutamate-ammonia-ligase adenylyltransferase|nr:glutamine-synthetase adenylyltransferase [Paracoccaceae bacterium]MDP7184167.1 glutamine-synthetase adenylyltransferase [Paracoccaceae bacterium]
MSFDAQLTRCPLPFNKERGREVRDLYADQTQPVQELIEGTAGCSPYLGGLLVKERDWFAMALDAPQASIASLFDELRELAPDALPNGLRRAKRRIAGVTALADLAGVWPLEQVTGTLTDFADLATHQALRATVGAEIRRKKLPGATEDDAETAGGLVALAMGKMGAGELNYSSDIDLICLFDESRYDRDDFLDARASLIRATRKMSAMLSDLTPEGYVFRTDLRLRPDPAVTPVCLGMEAAERYYESLGRTWERAAYIKARACAGSIASGAQFLKSLSPFIWRKHLDFAAIQDAHAMRLRIREHKGLGGPITLPGHHMKLGRGGIREIEFFTQTRQLIAGGRDPDLRVRGTVDGLNVLAAKDWIPTDTRDALIDHYRFHREIEHRVQMVNDAQTHILPGTDEGFERLACMTGRPLDELKRDLSQRLEDVHVLTEDFFAPDAAAPAESHGFDDSIISRWPTYPALRSERATEIFSRLEPVILSRLQRAARPDEALIAFDGFLSGLPAGVQLFSLFEANPQLIDLLLDVAGTSPDLARHLSSHASVFDAVIGGDFFKPWPGEDALASVLANQLAGLDDYENKLDTARRWAKEWDFRIGVHHLRGLISASEAGMQYAELASSVLRAVWPEVIAQFAEKHGPPPGRGALLLGMGSLGAKRLNSRSDLDLIVIYDAAGEDYSDGRRPLASRSYYARLTQALVTALSAPMAEGRLYEVDMRLRPSGNQGPVATSLESFKEYQTNSAWTWEHLALTRARVVTGPEDLADEVEAFRQNLLQGQSDIAKIFADTAEMREKIAAAKGEGGVWDAKIGAGRLQDIELLSQALTLATSAKGRSVREGLAAGAENGFISSADQEHLCLAYDLFWKVQAVAKLLSDKPLDTQMIGQGGRSFLLRETGEETLETLERSLAEKSHEAARVILATLKAFRD